MADDESTDEQTSDETEDASAEQDTGAEAKSDSDAKSEDTSGSDESGSGDKGGDDETGDDDDPDFGKKDDEPVNDVQMKYLKPLAEEQGEEIPDDMSEADAADKINEMQENASG